MRRQETPFMLNEPPGELHEKSETTREAPECQRLKQSEAPRQGCV